MTHKTALPNDRVQHPIPAPVVQREAQSPAQTPIKDQVKHGLDEALILLTGAQVLIGFQYSSVFYKGFEELAPIEQYLQVFGLALMLIALALIVAPVPYHRIVENGEDTQAFCHFIRKIVLFGLLPFAMGLGINVYIVTQKVLGTTAGAIAGVVATLTALGFWYVLEYMKRSGKTASEKPAMSYQPMNQESGNNSNEPLSQPSETKLSDKIDHVLTEARVVLPGAQALLGFQFATVLVEGFDKLGQSSKYLHLISLALMALSTILLMTPPAYHRIVEQGRDTEQFHQIAGKFVLAAMAFLALGISLNFYVVVNKVTQSALLSLVSTLLLLLLFYGFWFGFTFYRRRQKIHENE